jgi:predicted Zn-dependent peptidase
LRQLTTLPNGLRIISSPMPHTKSAAMGIFVAVGSRYEAPSQAGIAHFIEHVVFKGTQNYPTARQIANTVEGVGGMLNAATDKELTAFWCKVPAIHLDRAASVLTDLVRRPLFDPEETEKERKVIIEEINMVNDSPQQRSEILCDQLIWPRHPLGRDIAGSHKTVNGINREQLRAFWRANYRPERIVVSIAGNVSAEAVGKIALELGEWDDNPAASPFRLFTGKPSPKRLRLESRDTEQVNICMALPALSLHDPHRYTMDMVNIVLGEGSSSRLFSEIRDNLALSYDIQSQLQYYRDTGSLNIYAACDPGSLPDLTTAILKELRGLRKGISPAELAQAKELAAGRLLLRMEDSRSVSAWNGSQAILLDNILSVEEVIAKVEAVSDDDIANMVEGIVREDNIRLAVVGPSGGTGKLKKILGI